MPIRQLAVTLHRYLGLVIAGFLLMAGLTGSLIAHYDDIDVALNPELLNAVPPTQNAVRLDPLLLRERVQSQYPNARADVVELSTAEGRANLFRLRGSSDEETLALPNDEVLVNPYTGVIQGERKWGDITQGKKSLMSFLFRLHRSLLLGKTGELVMGIIALLWAINCFLGVWLTFPLARRAGNAAEKTRSASRRSWLSRWLPSWKVRTGGGSYALNFDLHRAGGLWPWAMLFVIAWSGVSFNLRQVYNPVMQSLFAVQEGQNLPMRATPLPNPTIDWRKARELGRLQMMLDAHKQGFVMQREFRLVYDQFRGVYRYMVRTDRDIRDTGGFTSVFIDGNNGATRAVYVPTGVASGDTVRSWITALHTAAVGGLPFRIFMSFVGVAVAMLSVTGIVIWWRKRAVRRRTQSARKAATDESLRAAPAAHS